MVICECPICDTKINLDGYEENDVLEFSNCGISLEIVSLAPPVLEELLEEDED
jgi:lysine biosynthesis protein LysW